MDRMGGQVPPPATASIAPAFYHPSIAGADLRAVVSARSGGGPSATTVSAAYLPTLLEESTPAPAPTYRPRHAGGQSSWARRDNVTAEHGSARRCARPGNRVALVAARSRRGLCMRHGTSGAAATVFEDPSVLLGYQGNMSGDGAADVAVKALVALLRQVVT